MKLDKTSIQYINNVIATAQLVGIDNIIIEPGAVRAVDDSKTVVIVQNDDVPDMPFVTIGLNRISVYQNRYAVAHTQDNFHIEAITDDSGEFARALVMKGKGIKIDYRCANPTTIKAPKKIIDVPQYTIDIDADGVVMFQKGLTAMGSETVTIVCNDGVFFEFVDDNNDTFKYQVTDAAYHISNNADAKFVYKYPAKVLLSLLKHTKSTTVTIGERGTLSLLVNDLNVTVLPKV